MRTRGAVSGIVVAAVTLGALTYGFGAGGFSEDGPAILGVPWGKVTLIDLLAGLFLFGIWIGIREVGWRRALHWWSALAVLGNLAAGLYTVWAAAGSRGCPDVLLMGKRIEDR